jgi:hypothetical protein
MKKIILTISLFLLSASTLAQMQQDYVMFHYNIHSDGKKWSDDQCSQMLSDPVYYNIVNDKPIYQNNPNLTDISYQRLSVTNINKQQILFTGKTNFTFQSKPYAANVSFVLDINQSMIRGSERIGGICVANFIGLQQHGNTWPHEV